MENSRYFNTVLEFLSFPIVSGDAIFEKFASIPNAIVGRGNSPLERYVYIPGDRNNKIVLVAHIDTIWDKSYNHSYFGERKIGFNDGAFFSMTPACGLGADDRAGCAMLWELRNSGHSILILDGEEFGKIGARYLKKSNKKVFNEINNHCFMIELDWKGTNCCLFNQVLNTHIFKEYISQVAGFIDSEQPGGCDLQILCSKICGVNLGVGYHNYHSNKEILILSEWENTLIKLTEFLKKEHKKFKLSFFRIFKSKSKRLLTLPYRATKKIYKSIFKK